MAIPWVAEAAKREKQFFRRLNHAMPSYQVPVADSPYTCPGWLWIGTFFSCVPDSMYPWDPAVLRAIREFEPTVVPLTVRFVYRQADYGNLQEPVVFVRHGIGRYERSVVAPLMPFSCDMPSTPIPGCRHLPRPNILEVIWEDKKEPGSDLPGPYLPFDWELYASLRQSYVSNLTGKELARKMIDGHASERAREYNRKHDEAAYITRDLEKFYSIEPSEVELKEAVLGREPPKPPPMVYVSQGANP